MTTFTRLTMPSWISIKKARRVPAGAECATVTILQLSAAICSTGRVAQTAWEVTTVQAHHAAFYKFCANTSAGIQKIANRTAIMA